jgi:hypothetical protein
MGDRLSGAIITAAVAGAAISSVVAVRQADRAPQTCFVMVSGSVATGGQA